MSGFQRPRPRTWLSAQVSTQGPSHPEIFLGVCGNGSVRWNWSQGGLGPPKGKGDHVGCRCCPLGPGPVARGPVATPDVLVTAPGLVLLRLCPEAQNRLARVFGWLVFCRGETSCSRGVVLFKFPMDKSATLSKEISWANGRTAWGLTPTQSRAARLDCGLARPSLPGPPLHPTDARRASQ